MEIAAELEIWFEMKARSCLASRLWQGRCARALYLCRECRRSPDDGRVGGYCLSKQVHWGRGREGGK